VRAVQVLKDLESDYRVRAEQNLKRPHSIGLMACTGNTHRRTRILLSVALSRYDTGVGVSGGTDVIAYCYSFAFCFVFSFFLAALLRIHFDIYCYYRNHWNWCLHIFVSDYRDCFALGLGKQRQ
jgi:hypothetical protein